KYHLQKISYTTQQILHKKNGFFQWSHILAYTLEVTKQLLLLQAFHRFFYNLLTHLIVHLFINQSGWNNN
ncbi:hypothetical protein, partial [Caldibacillus thermoamylovorans]|uniref:hypothetical protein n=1 Tax=Caldibacillus thermoamylovorans TaxID=35841 RepID=UPI0005C79D89